MNGKRLIGKPLVILCLVCLGAVCFGQVAGGAGTNLVSLVRTPPVKFSLLSVGLTREVEELSDASDSVIQTMSGVVREYGSDYAKAVASSRGASEDFTSQTDVSWGIKGGLSWGFIPHGDVSGGVGGGKTKRSHSRQSDATDVLRKYRLNYAEKEGTVRVTEDKHRLRLGKFRLSVKLALCASAFGETYRVGGPDASVVVEGLGTPITVPFAGTYELGAGPLVCELSRVVDESSLLAALLSNRDWSGVSVRLSGSQLPIVDARGVNVLSAEEGKERTVGSAEFSISLDNDNLLASRSPWRVRTSGRRGVHVTLRDGFRALEAYLAQDEFLPERLFAYDARGNLEGLVDKATFGRPRQRGKALMALAFCLSGEEPFVTMLPLGAETLDRDLMTGQSVRLVEIDVAETAENLYGRGRLNLPSQDTAAVAATRKALDELANVLAAAGDKRVRDAIETAKEHYAEGQKEQEEVARRGFKIAGLSMIRIPGRKFSIAQTEITQRQWFDIMKTNPSRWTETEDRPVDSVSREDAQQFINALNELPEVRSAQINFRLPTAEEWSYACRAGSSGAWGWVADHEAGTCDDMAWYKGNALGLTHPVGTKRPNAWNIFDMHGNVWEWLTDAVNGEFLLTGGSYNSGSESCRTGYATPAPGDARSSDVGFRVVAVEY